MKASSTVAVNMLRSLLLLLLALTAVPSAHAQAATRTDSPVSGGLRDAYDSRLALAAETRDPLASAASAERGVVPQSSARRSYWKVGAIAGGVLGAAVGGAGGLAFDNIEGGSRVGEYTLIGRRAGRSRAHCSAPASAR